VQSALNALININRQFDNDIGQVIVPPGSFLGCHQLIFKSTSIKNLEIIGSGRNDTKFVCNSNSNLLYVDGLAVGDVGIRVLNASLEASSILSYEGKTSFAVENCDMVGNSNNLAISGYYILNLR
jgi:hypothetical protein